MKIVIDAHIPFLKGVFEPFAHVSYFPGAEIRPVHLAGVSVLIIRTRTRVDAKLLEDSQVKMVASATIGTDHIDLDWCRMNGIKVVNAPGCNAGSVMQYVASALVFLARKKKIRFHEKTLGIIGVGNVGSKVERLAKTLGFKVLLNDPPRERKEGKEAFTDLETLLQMSDIISLHVPLISSGRDQTLELVNDAFLDTVKKDAILINTSRGQVVSDTALKKSLTSGTLGGAVLDVWNHEPALDRELLSLCDIGTPHVAGYSVDGKANGAAMVVDAVAGDFNLPLKGWYPANIPQPENPDIIIPDRVAREQEVLELAINHTYDIKADDLNLRYHPDQFELLRVNYQVRREFPAYTVSLLPSNRRHSQTLKKIGFNTKI